MRQKSKVLFSFLITRIFIVTSTKITAKHRQLGLERHGLKQICLTIHLFEQLVKPFEHFVDRSLTFRYLWVFPIRTLFRFAFHGYIFLGRLCLFG